MNDTKSTAIKRPVTGCDPCDNGCNCEVGSPGCSHFACWGVVSDELYNSCVSAAPHVERQNARLAGAR